MKLNLVTSTILIAIATVSCNSDKTNVLSSLDPASKEYKRELAKQFTEIGTNNLNFTFDHYVKVAGKDYLNVDVSGHGIQAKSFILVNNWNKIEGIKQAKGMGYRGAGLENLKIDIVNINNEPVFIYRDLDKIID
jgi:hypothetical protein